MFVRCVVVPALAALLATGCAHNESILSGDNAIFSGQNARMEERVAPVANGDSTLTEPVVLASARHAFTEGDGPYLLDSGDKLRVFVYGQPNLSRIYTVDHGGMITVPLIGAVKARGLTTFDLEGVVRRRLGAEYVRNPQVTIDVQQNRPFFILGEVKNAGQFPYVSGMTVETAIAIAGGYTERASARSFRVTRRVNGIVEQIEAPSDYFVKPGDTIFVYERFL